MAAEVMAEMVNIVENLDLPHELRLSASCRRYLAQRLRLFHPSNPLWTGNQSILASGCRKRESVEWDRAIDAEAAQEFSSLFDAEPAVLVLCARFLSRQGRISRP